MSSNYQNDYQICRVYALRLNQAPAIVLIDHMAGPDYNYSNTR